jgi:hypothetical protein
MAGYNIGISLSEDELNRGSSAIWNKLHPRNKVFVGSGQISMQGLEFTVDYDATEPPTFNLQPQPRQMVLEALATAARMHGATAEIEGLLGHAADLASSFAITFARFSFKFVASSEPPTTLVTDITVLCGVTVSAGVVHFVALNASAPQQPTVGAQFIVQNFILPKVQAAAGDLFAGLQIPPLSIPGVSLTPPVLVVANHRLYAAVLLAGTGTPYLPPEGIPGPNASFFMTLDAAAIQAAATQAVGQSGSFNKSGESGGSGFNAHYKFSYRLTNPKTSINRNELVIQFDLTGSVEAGVTVFWVPIGLGYEAVAKPTPTANCRIAASGSTLRIIEQSLVRFTLLAIPTGSIPTKVLSWMTEFIVASIVAGLTPLVTTFLRDIDFATLAIPSFAETIDGVDVTMTPTDLSIDVEPSGIVLAGRLQFS